MSNKLRKNAYFISQIFMGFGQNNNSPFFSINFNCNIILWNELTYSWLFGWTKTIENSCPPIFSLGICVWKKIEENKVFHMYYTQLSFILSSNDNILVTFIRCFIKFYSHILWAFDVFSKLLYHCVYTHFHLLSAKWVTSDFFLSKLKWIIT